MEVLKEAERLLAEGLPEKARNLVLRWRLKPSQSAEEYFRWGVLCEQLGLKVQAVECYETALSRNPDNPRFMDALAEVLYELGEADKAVALWRRALRYLDSEHLREKLASALREIGCPGSASVLTGASPLDPLDPRRYFPPDLGPRLLEPLQNLFSGRDLYAEVVLSSRGQTALIFRNERPSLSKLKEHLLGRSYLVIFPLQEDKTLKEAFLEILYPRKLLSKNRKNRAWLAIKREVLKKVATSFYTTVKGWGFETALEEHQPFCFRLWFFFETGLHFLWISRFLNALRERLPEPGEGLLVRAWIPTEGEGVGWRERGFELPLGLHPATLERSLFVNEEGEPYPDQLDFLKRLRPLSREEVKDFFRKITPGLFKSEYPQEFEKLRRSCAVVDHLVRKAEAGQRLCREEKLALFLTVGFLKNGRRYVHRLLSSTPDYHYAVIKRLEEGLPPRPISCAKLEVWFSRFVLENPCTCVFGEKARGRYPSPLLHVDPLLVPEISEVPALSNYQARELAGVYLHWREKLAGIEEMLKRYLKEHPGLKLRAGDFIVYLKEDRLFVESRKRRS